MIYTTNVEKINNQEHGIILLNERLTIQILMLTIVLFIAVVASTCIANADSDEYIKVGLKYGSSAVSSFTLNSDSGFNLGTVKDGEFESGLPVSAYTSLTITYENGCFVVRGSDGATVSADIGTNGCIMPFDYENGEILKFDSVPYRGGAFFTVTSGKMNIVNFIQVDDYTRGVVNSEMGTGNPLEALKAQAVAARSFAISNRGKHAEYGFDVCNNTNCQMYRGYSDEHEDTNKAVDETTNEVLYYDGEPVVGFYYKNSGGYTQDVTDVWGSDLGYLQAVKDEYSPSYPWSISYTLAELETRLSNAGYNVGSLKSVSISKRNANGAVAELTFNGTGGSTTITKEKIRTFFGASVVKSNMFSFTDFFVSNNAAGQAISEEQTGSDEDASTGTELKKLFLTNGLSTEKNPDTIYIIGADGDVKSYDSEDVYISNGTSKSKLNTTIKNSAVTTQKTSSSTANSTLTVETSTSDTITFKGQGYGHGVGMPQDSAIAMAKQGFDYEAILEYYYTDIDIKKI